MSLSTEQVRAIADGLRAYDRSHGNLPLFTIPSVGMKVGYRDVREAFEELAKLRSAPEQQGGEE